MSGSATALGQNDLKSSIKVLKRQPMNCAVGDIGKEAVIQLHHSKQPMGLMGELKKAHSKLNKPACGLAVVSEAAPTELRLILKTRPADGFCKRLAIRLRGTGLRKVVLEVDGKEVETFQDDDQSAAAGRLQQDNEAPDQGDEVADRIKARITAAGLQIRSIPVSEQRGKHARMLLGQAIDAFRADPMSAEPFLEVLEGLLRPQTIVTSPAMPRSAERSASDNPLGQFKTAMTNAVDDIKAALAVSAEKPSLDELRALCNEIATQSKQEAFGQARDLVARAQAKAVGILGKVQRRKEQRAAQARFEPVMNRVTTSYFTPASIKALEKLPAGETFKALVQAEKSFQQQSSVAGCDAIHAAADAYLVHFDRDLSDKERASRTGRAKYDNAMAAKTGARHMKLVLQLQALDKPDQTPAEAAKMAELRACLAFETGTQVGERTEMDGLVSSIRALDPALLTQEVQAEFKVVLAKLNLDTNFNIQPTSLINRLATVLQSLERAPDPSIVLEIKTMIGKLNVGATGQAEAEGPAHGERAEPQRKATPTAKPIVGKGNVSAAFWVNGFKPQSGRTEEQAVNSTDTLLVFKPAEGEQNIEGFPAGGGASREAMTHALSNAVRDMTGLDLGCPETNLISVARDVVDVESYNAGVTVSEWKGNSDAPPALDANKPAYLGSVQQFVKSNGALKDENAKLKPRVTAEAAQNVAMLDILSLNTDRHSGNVLVSKTGPEEQAPCNLIPIDHGLTLPSMESLCNRLPYRMNNPRGNTLLTVPGTFEKLPEKTAQRLDLLDPDAFAAALRSAKAEIGQRHPEANIETLLPDQSIEFARRSAWLLKSAARMLSPAVIQIMIASESEALFGTYTTKRDENFQEVSEETLVPEDEFQAAAWQTIAQYAEQEEAIKALYLDPHASLDEIADVIQGLGWGRWGQSDAEKMKFRQWMVRNAGTALNAYRDRLSVAA